MTWHLDKKLKRQKFKRNPLVTVIAQLRFHPILSISKGLPEFQEMVRKRFPKFDQVSTQEGRLVPPGTLEIMDHVELRFRTLDDMTTIVLGDSSIALENRRHIGRDAFFKDVKLAIDTLMKIYAPINPVRLGIRYINHVDRKHVETDLHRAIEWSHLINSDFLHIPGSLSDLESTVFSTEIRSPLDSGELTLRYGIVPLTGKPEPVFKLDVDRYVADGFKTEKTVGLLKDMVMDIYAVFMRAAGPALIEWMVPLKNRKRGSGARTS